MGRRHHLRQVVLQRLAQDRVEGQVGSHDVLLDPHLAPETLDLLPEAVQILKQNVAISTLAPSIFDEVIQNVPSNSY